MFKLLSIRPLPGCAPWIQKCLKTELMYYFNNDYIIEPGSYIARRSDNIEPLKSDFFKIPSVTNSFNINTLKTDFISDDLTINVSVVLGMNGDGKSTLVELMMRLINNCAFSYEISASSNSLKRVAQVKAELYYMIDDVVYRMAEDKDHEETLIQKVAHLNEKNLVSKGNGRRCWKINSNNIDTIKKDDLGCFFFTMVSNYSHYAYNISDYEKELTMLGDEKNDDKKCWLYYIFHQNDGYSTPIIIHPFRNDGNIDINYEKGLSKQRILSLLLNADKPADNKDSFRRVNEKDANVLVLTEEKESKLQQHAIIDFFKTTNRKRSGFINMLFREIVQVDKEIDQAAKLVDSDFVFVEHVSMKHFENLVGSILPSLFIKPLENTIEQDDGFCEFLCRIDDWIQKTNNNVLQTDGDIWSVVQRYDNLKKKINHFIKAMTYNKVGMENECNGNYDMALNNYDEAIKLAPDYVEAFVNRGNTRYKMRDRNGALRDYDNAIERNSDCAEIYCKRGNVKQEMSDYEGALKDYGTAIEVNPEYAKAFYHRSKLKLLLGDKKGAKEDNDKACDLGINQAKDKNIRSDVLKGVEKVKRFLEVNLIDINRYGFLKRFNVTQLGRLDTLYRILKSYGFDSIIVTKDYSELSLKEKCHHHIVYKVWSILFANPQFKKVFDTDGPLRECGPALEAYIEEIKKDCQSHVTRELRQLENFMRELEGFQDDGFYERLGKKVKELDKETGKETEKLLINIDELKEHYKSVVFSLDNLPPPIYKWDVIFNKTDDPNCVIGLDSLSSGEKQFLNSVGAIIYHLQNLDNTTSEVRYSNINLIMEEIELYYHPEYQRLFFIRLLDAIQRAKLENIKNINIVFVTHSPFILSDIPKCNVLFLKDGMPCDELQENTFGANIHSLLKHGFFMPNLPIGEFAYEKINELFKKLNTGDFNNDDEEKRKKDLNDIYQQILLVGEPFLRNQLLLLYNSFKVYK